MRVSQSFSCTHCMQHTCRSDAAVLYIYIYIQFSLQDAHAGLACAGLCDLSPGVLALQEPHTRSSRVRSALWA